MSSQNESGVLGQSIFVSRVGEGDNDISARKYNLVLGGCLFWGFLVNFLVCYFAGPTITSIAAKNPMIYVGVLIGYLVCAIAGIIISVKSDKPAVSFLGYNMVVLPLGIMLSFVVAVYPVATVAYAFGATAVITGLMVIMSEIFPTFFLSIGRGLFFSLLITILVEAIVMFLFPGALKVLDIVVVVIFCGYIGFDWARAQRIPYTVDNAIDAACSLYLDIINLFVRLLRIFGRES